MNPHSSIANSPPGSGVTARRRQFAAWLFVGWAAFWLTAVIAPCCDSLAATAQAGQESSAVDYRVQGSAGDGQRELPCPDLSHIQPASSSLTVASFEAPSEAISPPLPAAAPRAYPAVARVTPRIRDLGPPVAFHRRTARLLI
jgi:hypothetical protein